MAKGIFISLEGIDGSGKSTLIEYIQNSLLPEYQVVCVREPGGTFISEKIRELLLDIKNEGIAPETEAILYAAARAQLVEEVIKPALLNNNIVIADRFMDSTIAYQGFGRGLDLIFLQELNYLCTGGLKPDLTLLLDIASQEAQKRKKTDIPDRLEKEGSDFQERVRKGYLFLAGEEDERIKIIIAQKEIEAVKREAVQYVRDLITARWGKNEVS
ncbi:MAG TPA: dTMP kinase [Syntrophomonadaceae bacterium]|nr:dTMP kinase [Syntrophomonadaceae bacterium]HNX28890.1 dTMP kinase [Syntrophomonadaceae bacterium]HPR93243.1 dTMP kinase [Syntrophomonadaceae bacterium]